MQSSVKSLPEKRDQCTLLPDYLTISTFENIFADKDIFRLIKENICDKSTVPSVSAISRLLRGRDEEELKKSSKFRVWFKVKAVVRVSGRRRT